MKNSAAAAPLLALALALASAPAQVAAQAATQGASTGAVVSSLVINGIVFVVSIVGFLILRPRFKKVYQPKSYLGPEDERVPAQDPSLFGWIKPWLKISKYDILEKQGLDAFMFLEYLELMIFAFIPIFFLTWVILMPVYATGPPTSATGFEKFTFANITRNEIQQRRYVATLLVQWVVTFWMLYLIRMKTASFVKLRQEFIVSDKHANTAQARTLLVTGVSNDMLSEKKLNSLYSHLPGGVARVWLNRNLKDLPDLFDERLKWCNKLEGAEATLIKTAMKKVKKGKAQPVDIPSGGSIPLDIAEKYVEKKDRPTHKVGSKIPCMGHKVDTIEWCREEIERLNKVIEEKREETKVDYEKYPPQNSAFLLFNQQIAAHLASKAQADHRPYKINDRYIEAHPNNVVWSTLNMNPYEKKIRNLVFWGVTIALVIFWIIPVAFVGVVSNVSGLAAKVPFLGWLNSIPTVVVGIIQGILPTVLLAVLNLLLPIFLRLFAQLSGVPTRTGIELSLMDRFFLFQFINNFLFLTIISGSASQVTQFVTNIASNPTAFPGTIAQAIPKGSTFFLSFIALQGLSGAGSGFLQVAPLAIYYIKKFLLGSTPRKMWHIENDMNSVSWGTLFPTTSLITVIAIGYMVIAPILSGFTLVTFMLYYVLYRYNFTYVYDQKPETETSGLFFPKAINQIFAALYLEMVMLTALFFVAQADEPGGGTKQTAIPEGAFMVVLIVIVAVFHFFLGNSYGPLYNSLPLSLVRSGSGETVAGGSSAKQANAAYANGNSPSDLEKHASEGDGLLPSSSNGAKGSNGSAGNFDLNDPEVRDAFEHPAGKDPQRTLWFPNDRFSLGSAAVAAAHKHNLDATNAETSYNEKNSVTVSARVPPGEVLL